MIASTQITEITNIEVFAFIAVLVFKFCLYTEKTMDPVKK